MKTWILTAACVGVLACGLPGFAQRAANPQEPAQARQDDRNETRQVRDSANSGQRRGNVAELAGWLATCNQGEIELAKLAMERAQNDGVKQYAQRMVDDHSKFLNELRRFMPTIETGNPTTEGAAADRVAPEGDNPSPPSEQPTATVDRPNRTARNQAAAAGRGHSIMMQIGLQASKHKIAMTKDLLEEYQGQDFDMGFLGQQIVAHVEMLATLKAMQELGPRELQPTLQQGIQTTEGHLKHAKALAMQLEDKEGGTQPVRTETERQ